MANWEIVHRKVIVYKFKIWDFDFKFGILILYFNYFMKYKLCTYLFKYRFV